MQINLNYAVYMRNSTCLKYNCSLINYNTIIPFDEDEIQLSVLYNMMTGADTTN